jgi:hypothetical protein
MTIEVELHQCPSHQSILRTQGPIHKIFTKKFWELAILKKTDILEFFQKKKYFASYLW